MDHLFLENPNPISRVLSISIVRSFQNLKNQARAFAKVYFLFFFLIFVLAGSVYSQENKKVYPQFELSPLVTFYNGDAMRSTILGSASAIIRFNEPFWLGVDFSGGVVSVDEPNGLGIKSGESFFMGDLAFYWNLPALLGADKSKGTEDSVFSDFYTSVGMGRLWVNKSSEFYGLIGGGICVHTGWNKLLVKADLKNLFFVLNNDNGGGFNSDLSLSIGPGWLF